uniref:Uncharacterized protein n=1 Tax=Setaria viridis TaxID=4556 RepID=A0A4U6V094_SETVI|nr:hypothetical protein SEVIR_4G165001v2 [Setaria viridis]
MAFPRCTTRGPGPRRAQPTAAPGRAPASSRHARWGRTTRRSQAPAPEAWAEGGTGAGEPYLGAARPRPPAWETVRGRRRGRNGEGGEGGDVDGREKVEPWKKIRPSRMTSGVYWGA